jgi:cell division protein FtsI/penicillin-binding protein 2
MTLQAAITQSCNAYFLALGRDLTVGEANATLAAYDLPPVNAADKAMTLAGLSPSWQVTPRALAAAYLRLESDAVRNRFRPLLEGMRESAKVGTARAVSAALPATAVLAKTGTAPCRHTPRAMADGFTVIFFPAEDPRLFLLVREHGVTGAASAAVAGRMLRALEAGDQ